MTKIYASDGVFSHFMSAVNMHVDHMYHQRFKTREEAETHLQEIKDNPHKNLKRGDIIEMDIS